MRAAGGGRHVRRLARADRRAVAGGLRRLHEPLAVGEPDLDRRTSIYLHRIWIFRYTGG